MDNSRQVVQTSSPYEYGKDKPLKTKDEAMEKIKAMEQDIKTNMALKRIYEMSEVKIVEVPGAVQLVITTTVPKVVD